MMPFNEHIAREGAEAFVTNVLVNGLDARWVTVGEDFRFGSGRAAGAHDLERLAKSITLKRGFRRFSFTAQRR